MPTYEYECKHCGHRFEEFQSINDKPLSRCPKCGKGVRRLFGGGLGFLLAALVVRVLPVEKIKDYLGTPEINPAVGLATIAILVAIGIVSGMAPARRAASTNPIEALRK